MKQKVLVKDFLMILENKSISPNFYVSEDYLRLSKAKCYTQNGWIWVEADGWALFPALPLEKNFGAYPISKIWSDFENLELIPSDFTPEFLDWEYSFLPSAFFHMVGGKWETFRKNSRKWEKGKIWHYSHKFDDQKQICTLLSDWVQNKQKTIQDAEILVNYAFFDNSPGIFRKFLYTDEGLKAINAWDENYCKYNYRICITKEEPYLPEFTRILFYTDSEIQGKVVNDGGVLGNTGLEHFKDKMNPIIKRKVQSWKKKKEL